MCIKVRYASIGNARKACRKAAFRFRVYFCSECHWWHVTNGEKR
jgi:hypothetical protein